jgi:hypothetical protein
MYITAVCLGMQGFWNCRYVVGYVVPGVVKKCHVPILEGQTVLRHSPETSLSLKIKA